MIRGSTAAGVFAAAVLAASVAAFAVEIDREAIGDPHRAAESKTPVLNARRAPELLAGPRAARALERALSSWLARGPDAHCLLVHDETARTLFAAGPRNALVPASLQKLLTATASIEGLDAGVDVLDRLLRDSDDEVAENVVRDLGGPAAVRDLLADAGVGLAGVVVGDGSGHSRENRATCGLFVELLERPTTGPRLVTSLAVAGRSGTLAERLVNTPIVGRLAAKTGSLRDVASLAGVLRPTRGGRLTFAYIGNGGALAGQALLDYRDSLALVLDRHPEWGNLEPLLPAQA